MTSAICGPSPPTPWPAARCCRTRGSIMTARGARAIRSGMRSADETAPWPRARSPDRRLRALAAAGQPARSLRGPVAALWLRLHWPAGSGAGAAGTTLGGADWRLAGRQRQRERHQQNAESHRDDGPHRRGLETRMRHAVPPGCLCGENTFPITSLTSMRATYGSRLQLWC
jgi:hypothetical protein